MNIIHTYPSRVFSASADGDVKLWDFSRSAGCAALNRQKDSSRISLYIYEYYTYIFLARFLGVGVMGHQPLCWVCGPISIYLYRFQLDALSSLA